MKNLLKRYIKNNIEELKSSKYNIKEYIVTRNNGVDIEYTLGDNKLHFSVKFSANGDCYVKFDQKESTYYKHEVDFVEFIEEINYVIKRSEEVYELAADFFNKVESVLYE